ncbi:MAG: sensor histidine kinase [Gammaproteobacteria bacterium]|nr:sensor histidine kinase [Gammaproteobacteria bacterium]
MRSHLAPLLKPLNLAALLTLLTVAASIHGELGSQRPLAWALLAAFSVLFLLIDALSGRPWLRATGYAALAVIALALVALAPRTGTSPVLLVILVAALAIDYPPSRVLPAAVLLNVALYLVLRANGHAAPAMAVTVYLGFQAFAALVAHYARSAEQARDRLALVNADLLATRALLADSARDAERLRFARELHDVAGHKLTALTLNLRALADRQEGDPPAELEVSRQLAAELMDDLRELVQQLRDDRGLDLATALRALAAPLPRPALRLAIDEDVRIGDPATADALLRMVQEALTNSARHGQAQVLDVRIGRDGSRLEVSIEDDGRIRGPLREGNGLAGMRERLAAAGGQLAFSTSPGGALRIDASLPA